MIRRRSSKIGNRKEGRNLLQQIFLQKHYAGIKLKIPVGFLLKPLASSLAITYHAGVPCFFNASNTCSLSLTGTRGSFFPATTSIGFLIFSMLFIGAIFSRNARIFGSRSSPYPPRRKSRR